MKFRPYVLATTAALAMMAYPFLGAIADDATPAAPATPPAATDATTPPATDATTPATPAAPDATTSAPAATPPAAGTAVNAAPAAAAAANTNPANNWLKVCDTPPKGQKICIIRQIVVANNKVIGSLVIRQNPNLKSPFLAMGAVPIGVALPPGVSWRIDNGKPVNMPYAACDPQTCVSVRGINSAFINSLKKGKKLILTARTGAGKSFSIEIVLAGFAEAYDSPNSMTVEQLRKGEAGAAGATAPTTPAPTTPDPTTATPTTPAPTTPAPTTPAPATPAPATPAN